jgi:mannosyl-oligosaccharide alpha-1,2-mannosidase
MDVFYKANVTDGLFHDEWDIEDGTPSGSKFIYHTNSNRFLNLAFFFSSVEHFTIGPPSDSAYEYLLKQWVQNGDPKARQQCKSTYFLYPELVFKRK